MIQNKKRKQGTRRSSSHSRRKHSSSRKHSSHSSRSRGPHSRRCIFRYKHTRRQHRKRQHGGVSEDLPTTLTVAGTPLLANAYAVVSGKPPMTLKEYKKMAENDELSTDEY